MAGPAGQAPDRVDRAARLKAEPYRFHLFQALRLLECLHADRPRLGRTVKAADDPVRLGQEPSLAFAPSTVASFQDRPGQRSKLEVFSFGVFGPNGPLPLHLSEYARDRLRNQDDPTFARFADIFHHRFLALFYRAWADAQPAVQHDRADEDRFRAYLGSVCGMGTPALWGRDAVPDPTRFHFAAHFAIPSRHPEGLRSILADFFDVPVRIREFVGHWIRVPDEDRLRLGGGADTSALGTTAILGGTVWGCQEKFRVVFGPVGFHDFERMLPGSESLDRLVALVRSYVGDEYFWDLNLILKKEDVPPLRLGRQGRLGWTSWLTSVPPDHDADGLLLDPLAVTRLGGTTSTPAATAAA